MIVGSWLPSELRYGNHIYEEAWPTFSLYQVFTVKCRATSNPLEIILKLLPPRAQVRLEGHSCRLRVRGSAAQIEAIVRTSDHVDARTADFSKLHMGVTVRLEDVGFPAGKSWGVNVDIRETETAEVIADKVRKGRDEVELSIAPDWSLEEDLLQGFMHALL
jgi:hypothetical protein